MRNKVIKFFQNLPESKGEQFNKAFELFRESPNKNESQERVYNAVGFTDYHLENILYDLQKMHGIQDYEKHTSAKVVEDIDVDGEELVSGSTEGAEGTEKVLGFQSRKEDNNENQFLPLREEFPFLADKDCPNELKILVADKITIWKTYQETQNKIADGKGILTEVELAELAKSATEDFAANQAIYEELNAYKETGKVLGKHAIFKTLSLSREIEKMTNTQLINFKLSSAKYLSDNKKLLEEAGDDEERVCKIKDRIALREQKLALVNKKLGVNAK